MKKHTYRLLSWLLAVFLLLSLLPAAFAQDAPAAGDLLWAEILALRDGVKKRGETPNVDDFAAISDDVYALVEASGTARADSLLANGDFIRWIDDETGISCCYSPALEADKAAARAGQNDAPDLLTLDDLPVRSAARGGGPSSWNIGLIQPCWESSSHYADSSFSSYSPYYVQQATALASATGGSLMRYAMENATVDTIAYALQNCGFVIFDSHGGTDYSSGSDYTSQANTSYLWLYAGSSSLSAIQTLLEPQDYQATHTGEYSVYSDVIYSGDLYGVNGTVIANHMDADAPHNMLYMGICLGMATDGIYAPLREKGVEVVYGYSQSITFVGEKAYMLAVTNSLLDDKNVAEAVAAAKSEVGVCDPYESSYPAYPIVVSSEDAYPGQGHVDAPQTVLSTWRLIEPHTVTVNVTNPECGGATVDAYDITTTPIAGYYPAEVTVTEGSGTFTVSGTHIYVHCTTDVTVSITFAPKPQVTLSFAGIACDPISGTADDIVTLPRPTSTCDGYDFVGWTEEEVAAHEATPGLSEAYLQPGARYTLPYEDTVLHALYRHVDHNGTPSVDRYVRVTSSAMLQEGGSYLLTINPYFTSGAYVFNGGLAAPNVNENYKGFSFLDASETAIASSGATDACAIQIEPIDGTGAYGLRLQNGAGKYFGNLGSSATFSTRDASKGPYPMTVDVVNGSAGAFVRIYNAEGSNTYYFCFYSHSTSSTSTDKFCFKAASAYSSSDGVYSVALYKKVAGVDGTLLYTGEAIACAHENAVAADTAPTCTEAGYTTYLCPTCGYKWTAAGEAALGHSYEAVVTAPTATEQGYTTHTCAVCGDVYTDSYTDPYGVEYQVTYSILGHLSEPVAVNSFIGTTLPTTDIAPEGYTFAGWSRTELLSETTSAGLLTGTFKPTADTTLYAVYVRSEFIAGNGDYVRVESSSGLANGKTLIVYEAGGIAFNGSFATTSTALNKANNYVSVSIENGRIASTDEVEAAAVTFSRISSTNYYSILLPCSKYMGSTGSSTGINVNASTVYQNSVTISDGKAAIANVSGNNIYYFVYSSASSSNRFAYYNPSNSTSHAVAVYQKDNGHTVNYYTTAPDVSGCAHENVRTEVTAPTCTEAGFTLSTCLSCGEAWTGEETAALGHDYGDGAVVLPTPEAFGYTVYTCSRCGASYQDSFTGWDYQITCSVAGVERDPVTVNGLIGAALPETCDPIDGYTFVGWSASPIDPESTTAELLDGVYYPTEDATVYAVYSRTQDETPLYTTMPDCLVIRSAVLVLNGKLDLAFTAQVSAKYSNVRMVFEGPNGETTETDYEVRDGKYVFTYTGINPQCIGDSLTATLCATANGVSSAVSIESYSVRQYCVNQLANETISAELRTLLSDLLAYGAAAQTYMGYRADALVTQDVDTSSCSSFAELTDFGAVFDGVADADVYWISAGLTLTDSVEMTLRFHATAVDGLSVYLIEDGRTQTFTEFTPVPGEENVYVITRSGISAEDYGSVVTAGFERDDEQVGNDLYYSVNAYVQARQNDENAALAALVRALYNYGASAAAYAAAE
ncbi:MAG: InlB B-repeat-containing protein [Oscillospiraceae bacterium]|nr:InlB B-repeat-containing protein [Oscillospiraceae bacterium]